MSLLTDTTKQAINAFFEFIYNNYPATPTGWIEFYQMPNKDEINFNQFQGIKDYAILTRFEDEHEEDLDLGGSMTQHNVLCSLNIYRRQIADPDPEFYRPLWHMRMFIEKLIRSNPFALEQYGMAYLRLTGVNPFANVRDVIDPMIRNAKDVYVTQIYVNIVYHLDVERIS